MTFENIFSQHGSGLFRRLGWKQGDEDESWSKKAIDSLMKKLQKHNKDALVLLDEALRSEGREPSQCIFVSKYNACFLCIKFRCNHSSLPGRPPPDFSSKSIATCDVRLLLSINEAHFSGFRYCRVYRWPDLQSHHELKALPCCRFCFESGQQNICINPYHYERIDSGSLLPPVLVPRYSEPPPPPQPTAVFPQMQPGVPVPTLEVGPSSSQSNTAPVVVGHIPVPFVACPHWATISYYELNTRVSSPTVLIDGFTDPTNNPAKISLGLFSNVNRNTTIESTRRHIGKGVKLTYVPHHGSLYAECQSESAIFVQSRNCNYINGFNPTTVCKITTGFSLKIFDSGKFGELLNQSVNMGFNSSYELTKMTIIRMSFVKGWGADYQRQDVTSRLVWSPTVSESSIMQALPAHYENSLHPMTSAHVPQPTTTASDTTSPPTTGNAFADKITTKNSSPNPETSTSTASFLTPKGESVEILTVDDDEANDTDNSQELSTQKDKMSDTKANTSKENDARPPLRSQCSDNKSIEEVSLPTVSISVTHTHPLSSASNGNVQICEPIPMSTGENLQTASVRIEYPNCPPPSTYCNDQLNAWKEMSDANASFFVNSAMSAAGLQSENISKIISNTSVKSFKDDSSPTSSIKTKFSPNTTVKAVLTNSEEKGKGTKTPKRKSGSNVSSLLCDTPKKPKLGRRKNQAIQDPTIGLSESDLQILKDCFNSVSTPSSTASSPVITSVSANNGTKPPSPPSTSTSSSINIQLPEQNGISKLNGERNATVVQQQMVALSPNTAACFPQLPLEMTKWFPVSIGGNVEEFEKMKLLSKFPPNIPNEVAERHVMVSHRMLPAEAWIFNIVNACMYHYELGCQIFSPNDELVDVESVEHFYWVVKEIHLTNLLNFYDSELVNIADSNMLLKASILRLKFLIEKEVLKSKNEIKRLDAAANAKISQTSVESGKPVPANHASTK
ncbi:MH2 domain-containing protein [Ditylenchus destructor]|nr:MH2 domain-containing protein [Ditylenchus destructor]